jgi:hypothetical protein
LAAATETTPVSATAPAIVHRLTREIRASPASRALVALGFTINDDRPGSKEIAKPKVRKR